MNTDAERMAVALGETVERIDWVALGAEYCEEGGEEFFDDEARDGLVDTGLRLASDVAEVLEAARCTLGRSLYVGAGVAELPLLLCESLVLRRKVVCAAPPSHERALLDEALAAAEESLGWKLPRYGQQDLPRRPRASLGSFDHVWLVSVLNDPEAFPALHDWLYERGGTELATGKGDRRKELARAEELVERLQQAVDAPALWTTTDEELPIVGPALERAGWRVAPSERARLSAVVGDPVRILRLGR